MKTLRTISIAALLLVVAGCWKDDMGGYQVWLSHGSGLYTAYYHMSAITVNIGEHVGRGSQIGRVGQSGVATGPHCHFEVWHGYPWQGSSYRSNPLAYLLASHRRPPSGDKAVRSVPHVRIARCS